LREKLREPLNQAETEPLDRGYAEVRNTAETHRVVVPVRLSAAKRNRISKAAEARDLAFSSFVRWAALERAADELERAKPKPRPKVEREPIILGDDLEPPAPRRSPSARAASWTVSASVAAWTSTMCVAGIAPARRTAARW
jgi:hypothetical protein